MSITPLPFSAIPTTADALVALNLYSEAMTGIINFVEDENYPEMVGFAAVAIVQALKVLDIYLTESFNSESRYYLEDAIALMYPPRLPWKVQLAEHTSALELHWSESMPLLKTENQEVYAKWLRITKS